MDERKMHILGAIVEDYVATREPVGSKALLERHDLGVSPATVRNDMSVLEDEGLIAQPYTSAGRIPTDKGYRVFVDNLAHIKPLSAPERRAITTFLDGASDLDDLLSRTVRLLAQLTRQVAMVQYPSLHQAKVCHVEVVAVAPGRILVVLITDAGWVDQRTIDVIPDVTDQFVHDLRTKLNAVMVGQRVTDLQKGLDDLVEGYPLDERGQVQSILAAVHALLDARREDRIVLAGTANLARWGIDIETAVEPLLDALEEQIVLLRLLTEMSAQAGEIQVRIGHEMPDAALTSTSVVSAGYAPGQRPGAASHLAILGPTRMDYVAGISSVHAVARYMSRFLG
ncbi:heat-inducible transcriptional repressor HrcA [Devriesea agamarum]|uniref:heat-inducible transcriptional repressor HrcA n=1 Tax=Devriesea agamarum TaxID=472569 RepID=UPI00071DB7B7|nr:heat-inducible transcriptional repressor HrcA [Devriesea agamarum]